MVKYAFQEAKEKGSVARASTSRRSISTKKSIEICNNIRGETLGRAKAILEGAINMKNPIKFSRFTNGAGHKSGHCSAKYPVKAAAKILELLKSAEANAQNKGIGPEMVVLHAAAHQAARSFKYGRQSRRKEKSTNVELVLAEAFPEKTDAKIKAKEPEKTSKNEKPAREAKPRLNEKPAKAKENHHQHKDKDTKGGKSD